MSLIEAAKLLIINNQEEEEIKPLRETKHNIADIIKNDPFRKAPFDSTSAFIALKNDGYRDTNLRTGRTLSSCSNCRYFKGLRPSKCAIHNHTVKPFYVCDSLLKINK